MTIYHKLKKYIPFFLFFILVFIAGLVQHDDPDMYIHLAMGNIIAHQGIIHHEVLSQAGPGREYIPYEWLFQLFFYQFVHLLGFASYQLFTAIFAIIQTFVLGILLRKVFRLTTLFTILLSALYVVLTYNYFVPRPQIIANTFLILTLTILFTYILHRKNYLYLLLPVAYIWGNIHPSVVLSILLSFGYSAMCFLGIFTKNRALWLKRSGILALYALLICIVTILPPQGFNAYKDIWLIFKYGYINAAINQEWVPLLQVPYQAIFYSLLVAITLISLLFMVVKKKIFTISLWISPMIIFILYGYLSLRNVYFGYLGVIILAGGMAQRVTIQKWTQLQIVIFGIFAIALFGYGIKTTYQGYYLSQYQFPAKAADFIQKENLQGNMFNEFTYGGYLEYKLYPSEKVFIDGRVETFFCCELQDYYQLYKNLPSTLPIFQDQFNNLLGKYHSSYAILVSKNPIDAIFGLFLTHNPQWMLLYQDSISQIWVKRDGKNSEVLKRLVTSPHESESEKLLFYSSVMGMSFNYPHTLTLTQITSHLVSLSNPSQTSNTNSLFVYSTTIPKNTTFLDSPFTIPGKLIDEIPIPVQGFSAKQQTYDSGVSFLVLRHNQQFIIVRIPKDSQAVADAITDFVNTVKTFQ